MHKKEFTVAEYVPPTEYTMNNVNSTLINEPNYKINDTLVFNYTNADNLIWNVQISGTYEVDTLGAGGKSFTHKLLTKPIVNSGHNTGNGMVKLKLISK